jgi:hypothetical protein
MSQASAPAGPRLTGAVVPQSPGPQGAPYIARGTVVIPPPSVIKINFQPASATPVPGYLIDDGSVFGPRGNGQTYGWNTNNTGQARDRNDPKSPDQRYDTLNQLQRPENPDAVWELAVPNGQYRVRLVAGDPTFVDTVERLSVEGVQIIAGTPTAASPWIEGTIAVTVTDGRLTLRSMVNAVNSKVCFIEVTPQ